MQFRQVRASSLLQIPNSHDIFLHFALLHVNASIVAAIATGWLAA
jgi:hypothetical protein